MQRSSIVGMMGLVLLFAVGLTALRNANEVWAGTMLGLVLGMVGAALLGSLYLVGKDRAWCVGLTLFSGGYLTLALGPWFSTAIQPKLLTTQLLDYVHSQATRYEPETSPPNPPPLQGRPRWYLEVGAKLFNTQRFDLASEYLDAANRSRDQLSSDEAAILDAYLKEVAKVKIIPTIPPPTAIGPNRWRILLPGAANQDALLTVGHGLFAVLAGLAGAIFASHLHGRRERGESANV